MKVNADNRLPADPAKLDRTTAFSLYAIFRDFARAINSKQEGIQFEDDGSNLGTSGSVTEVDFAGAGVTATRSSDKVTVTIPGGGSVSDAAYGAGWDGDTTTAPSKNAVYDKIQTLGGGVTLSDVYPVGSIYTSVVSTNPATLFGMGTWSAIGAGRVLVGIDSGDTDFDTVEETGGAKTVASAGSIGDHASHTHSVTSNVAVGNHSPTQPTIAWPAGVPTAANESSHTHTYTQVIDHVHVERAQGGTTASTTGTHLMTSTATGGSLRSSAQSTLNPTGSVGATGTTAAGSAHTHTLSWPAGVPTASGGGVDAHSVTNNAVTSGNPSATLTHTYTGSATSVVQPYLVVYMWKRTA